MTHLKSIFIAIAFGLSTMACIPVFAQSVADMALGEVRKIDKEARKITIKHGEIKELDMPPMSMVFTLKDPAVLENFKVGDKVKFKVVREDGKMLVTELQNQ
jgi:Cu(I)/Ag(I) efflux system protein CusF